MNNATLGRHGIITKQPHNPTYKLISATMFNGHSFVELVYGIAGDGSNEGLELYFKHERGGHFYRSRRYLTHEVPPKYKSGFEVLKSKAWLVQVGWKAHIKLPNV